MIRESLAACVALAALSSPALGDAGGAAPPARTLGFAITNFAYAMAKGSDAQDCPQGFALTGDKLYLATRSPAERTRLTRPENAEELKKRAFYTADGREHCEAWAEIARAPQYAPQGRVSRGFDLDGRTDGQATATSCAHEPYTSPEGTPGIDNQVYRVVGCIIGFRGQETEPYGFLEAFKSAGVKDGITTLLLEVTGVDDARDDPDVLVGFYVGTDRVPIDAAGGVLPDGSLSVLADPAWRSRLKGRIEKGVLVTEPGSVDFYYDMSGSRREIHMRAGRIRLELAGDGVSKGLLGGYIQLADLDPPPRPDQAERVALGGYDCPAYRQAVRRYADGFPDAGGQCTAISAAFDIEAVPAFVIHDRPQSAELPAGAAR